MWTEWLMVVSLGFVVVVQQVDRALGAGAAILWLVALGFFGGRALYEGQHIQFLSVDLPSWLFAGFTSGMLAYNGWVLVRVQNRRSHPIPASESPSPSPQVPKS